MHEDELFCPECGFKSESVDVRKVNTEQIAPQKVVLKQPMTRKNKILLGSITILVIAFASTHLYLANKFNSDEKLKAVVISMNEGDSDALLSEIVIPENTIYEKEIYLNYLENQDDNYLLDELLKATEYTLKDNIPRYVNDEFENEVFKISNDPFLFFYPRLKIEAVPIPINAVTDIENGVLTIAGKTFKLSKEETELGKALPGEYVLKYEVEDEFNLPAKEFLYDLQKGENEKIQILSEELMVTIPQDYAGGILVVDGEKMNESLEGETLIGPFIEDESITLQLSNPNGISEEVNAMAGETVSFYFPSSEETEVSLVEYDEVDINEQDLTNFYLEYRQAYENALNAKNFSLAENYLLEGSVAYDELVEFVGDIGNDYYLYEFNKDEIINYEVNPTSAKLFTYEEFDFTNHEGVITNYKRNKEYDIVLHDDGYLKITNIKITETVRD
jgi:hypothetical protein